jgi:DHA3 family macrolide efflux protein-like MFS transporter
MQGKQESRNVVIFCLAYLLSAFGYEFMVFVMTVHIYDLTGSALNVGLFTALTFLPRLLSPYYGSLSDRYPRGRIFSVAAMGIALGIFLVAGSSGIAWTYTIWFFISILLMTIMNVRPAIMTEILPKDNYLHGNSIMLISLNAARLAAPMIGGLVALKWNITLLLHLTAVVYVVAALLGLATRLAPPAQRASRSADSVLTHMREGARYLLANRDLRYLGTVAFLWRLCLGCQLPLFVVYVKQFLGRGSDGYGIFMTMAGVGSVMGSVMGPRLAATFDRRKLILWGLAAHYLTFACLGISRSFPVSLALVTISFAFFYTTIVSTHSLRDQATPIEYRGRVYGCITGILTPAALVSFLVGSYLAGVVGVEKVLIGAGGLALVSLAALQARQDIPVPVPSVTAGGSGKIA